MPDRLFNDGASPRVIFRPTSKSRSGVVGMIPRSRKSQPSCSRDGERPLSTYRRIGAGVTSARLG
jgi:hypothetical protein